PGRRSGGRRPPTGGSSGTGPRRDGTRGPRGYDNPVGLRDEDVGRLRAAIGEETFDQRFELVREAGSGGMGRVFEAIDREGGARVAVKLLARLADRARFAAEVEVLERLAHPAIVRYIRHGVTRDGEPYLAMEWLVGESLSQR